MNRPQAIGEQEVPGSPSGNCPPADRELKRFLKIRRDRISPADCGLVSNGRRRSRGLTREHVAQLAGVSFKWYSLFESGQVRGVSRKFVERVCAVLRLSAAERRHLFDLVGLPPAQEAAPPPQVPEIIKRLADAQTAMPVAVYSNVFDVLYANRLYEHVFERRAMPATLGRNKILRLFLDPQSRREWRNWESVARRVTSELRYLNGAEPHSPEFQRLFAQLQADPDFRRLWSEGSVDILDSLRDRFELNIEGIGALALSVVPMTIPEQPRLFFCVLMPADDASAVRLRRLARRARSA